MYPFAGAMNTKFKLSRNAGDLGEVFRARSEWPLIPFLTRDSKGQRETVNAELLDSLVYSDIRTNFIVRVSGARVIGDANVVINNRAVGATDGLVFNPLNPNKIFGSMAYQKTETPGTYIVESSCVDHFDEAIFVGGSKNYGHWIHNHLARLLLVPETVWCRCNAVVVPEWVSDDWVALLSQVVDRELNVIRVPKEECVNFQTLWVPSMPWHFDGLSMRWTPHLVQCLHRIFVKPRPALGSKRVFISRRSARWRRCVNEDTLIDVLRPLGFERYDMANLTISQQLDLGRESHCVVAPMGAGANFHLFMPPGTSLIELGPQGDQMLLGPFVTAACNQRYNLVLGEAKEMGPLGLLDADFFIDPAKLLSVLEELGIAEKELTL